VDLGDPDLPQLHLAYDLGGSRAYYWGSVVIGVFETMVDADGIRIFRELHRELRPQVGMFSTLSVVVGELEMNLDNEVRRIGGEMTREFDPVALAAATVVQSGGIKAAFLRSVITGMHLVGRSTTPHRVFRKTDDALAWILALDDQEPRYVQESAKIRAAVAAVQL